MNLAIKKKLEEDAVAMEVIDETLKSLNGIVEHRMTRPTTKSDLLNYKMLVKEIQIVKDAIIEGRQVVSYDWVMHRGILDAMSLTPMMLLHYTWVISEARKQHQNMLNLVQEYGLGVDICGGHRIPIGVLAKGWVPQPEAHISYGTCCDDLVQSWRLEMEFLHCPHFLIDQPAANLLRDKNAMANLKDELEDLVTFLENVTKKRMNWDKFAEIIKRSQRQQELKAEIRELLKHKPSALPSYTHVQSYWLSVIFAGTPELTEYLETVRDEMVDRISKGVGAIPNEKFRLMSFPPFPTLRKQIIRWVEKEHNAVIAMDTHWLWDKINWDPEKPLDSVAEHMLLWPISRYMFNPPLEKGGLAYDMAEAAREHQIDGVIIWGNPACRGTAGAHRMIKDLLKKQGVSTLIVDNCPSDIHYTTEEKLKDTFGEFIEILKARK